MKKMIRSIIITILTIGLIGVGYWGYQEHQDKNALLIHAENNYQRSFHELTYHMDLLHDKIGTALAMNTGHRLSPQFVDIWRLTSQALQNVGQLPLTLLPFNKTEEFLSNIGDFTYKTAIRNLDDDPLTEDELKALKSFYEQAAEIKDELRKVQYATLQDNLRWMDVELALATEEEPLDNTIIDGLKTVEKKVTEFAESSDGLTFMQTSTKTEYRNVSGEWKSEEQIRDFTKELFDIPDDVNITITKSGEGANIPTYSVSYKDGKDVYMDITQQGGHPINILVNREFEDKKISLNEGMLIAKEYLNHFNYENMEAFQSQEYDRIGVYSFMYKEDDIRVFPDTVVVQVALDNGDIIGFNAQNYLMNHHKRNIPEPALTMEEALEYVNPNIDIQETHLAIIENEIEEEVLTYEFLGIMDDETYRIFINAENGMEEKVEKLTGTETNFEVMM